MSGLHSVQPYIYFGKGRVWLLGECARPNAITDPSYAECQPGLIQNVVPTAELRVSSGFTVHLTTIAFDLLKAARARLPASRTVRRASSCTSAFTSMVVAIVTHFYFGERIRDTLHI